MGFLQVDKNKRNRRGVVYVAYIEERGLVIGTVARKTKVQDIMIELATRFINKKKIPAITLMLYKKSTDVIKEEARLNSALFEYYDKELRYLKVDIDTVKGIW